MAYGAGLESQLGAIPQGFKSLILRQRGLNPQKIRAMKIRVHNWLIRALSLSCQSVTGELEVIKKFLIDKEN